APVYRFDDFPYNPQFNTCFSPLRSENLRRYTHGEEKYLICGGFDVVKKTVLSSCEIFDSGKIGFVRGPFMNYPRLWASATLLKDGRVVK
ncbi:MAG: hypothetical protein Q9N34_08600, partial [Aquificota bacterium]|nr:hypothetical protein [Aquificota bacterium]